MLRSLAHITATTDKLTAVICDVYDQQLFRGEIYPDSNKWHNIEAVNPTEPT